MSVILFYFKESSFIELVINIFINIFFNVSNGVGCAWDHWNMVKDFLMGSVQTMGQYFNFTFSFAIC